VFGTPKSISRIPRLSFQAVLLLAVLLGGLSACGEGAGSGGGTPPTEPPIEENVASIVADGGVEIGLCPGLGLECNYSQDYKNVGTGCGNNIRGKVRAFQGDALLETVDWSLPTSLVIQVGEVLTVEDCCITADTARAANRYTGEAFWNNVSCK
jgi:hypothetical protein